MPTSVRKNIVNNIQKVLFAPCADTPLVAIELASEAIVLAAATIISPDPKEIYHKVTGEPIVHTVRKGVEDIGDAHNLEPTPVRRALGKLLGRIDRIIWWLFVFKSLEDGLVDATSNFMKMEPCLNPNFFGDGDSPFGGIFGDGRWSGIDFSFPAGSNYFPAAPSQIGLNAGNNWKGTIMAQVTFETVNLEPKGVSGRIQFVPFDGSPPMTVDHFTNENPDGSPSQKWHVLFAHFQAPGARDGVLKMEWSYNGPPVPDNELIVTSGNCYFSGGGGGH